MPTRKPPFSYSLIGLLPRSTQQILQKGFCHPLFAPIKRASRTQHPDEDESSIAKYQKYPLRVTARSEFYEKDLPQNAFDGYELAVDYLGVPLVRPEISLQKLESRPVEKMVSDYSQLRERLRGTEYEWMYEQ